MDSFPDFTTYFEELWNYPPFPWQLRLADQLTTVEDAESASSDRREKWPAWMTLPTGTGKTSAIDIAIYDLARQAARPSTRRSAPVRIIFAVNRRIVVDEAYQRALHIAEKLRDALSDKASPLHPVATALSDLSGVDSDQPLQTFPLRGGTFTDNSWARTPTQPLVLTTTLDQLGSRLLFSGYGVSPGARPIQAALLANDALLILDEAHTAKAFSQTLEAVEKFRRHGSDFVHLPFAAVQLTATPPTNATGLSFGLEPDDRSHEDIRRRLAASKPTTLIEVADAIGTTARHRKMADAMAAKAIDWAADHRRILIVVNRVATAEALAARLGAKSAIKQHEAEVEILTGRLRLLDRDRIITQLSNRHQLHSSSPTADVPRLILVATQTIEVGADYDFDALLTELAPIDALRQRFGRLNRTGRDIDAAAAIFAPEEALDTKKSDPLYGDCLPAVWNWIQQHADDEDRFDFGLDAYDAIAPTTEQLADLLAPTADAPLLLAPHLDLLCQTSPQPHVLPDSALYIHGPGRDFPQVSVILRADLDGEDDPLAILRTSPPIGAEAASLPLPSVRSWLDKPQKDHDQGGDVPDATVAARGKSLELGIANAFLWRSGEPQLLKRSNELHSGDILLLNSHLPQVQLNNLLTVPGISSTDPWSLDQFESACLLARDRLTIRFHRGAVDELKRLLKSETLTAEFDALIPPLQPQDSTTDTSFDENTWRKAIPDLTQFLAKHLPDEHPWQAIWKNAAAMTQADRWRIAPYPNEAGAGVILTHPDRVGASQWPLEPTDLGSQNNQSDESVELTAHCQAVSRRAFQNARELPEHLADTLRDAGLWHDLGKADPRFQSMLHGCTRWAVANRKLLAKSEGFRPLSLRRFFQSQAELPKGFRHELLSAALVAESDAAVAHPERELLLHLIASHHGHCRGTAPVVLDAKPEPVEITLGGDTFRHPGGTALLADPADGVTERFWNLTRRYGWWGLPYFEALLRLADQYESAHPTPTEP